MVISDLFHVRAQTMYIRRVKPVLDRIGAAILIVILAPVFLAVALLVRLKLGPGVIFIQSRVGRGGRVFGIYKFRTMAPDRRLRREPEAIPSAGDRRLTHKSADDPRHTALGRVLRKLALDELPQLFNVLKGDMSLVGPRPELTEVVARYEPWQHLRHQVKPGVTGLWQVSGRGSMLAHEATHLDLEYITKASLIGDLWLLAATSWVLLMRRSGT